MERSIVWMPTDVAGKDLKTGPPGPGAFAFRERVTCTYRDKDMSGNSPKFTCVIGDDDEVKVKFGGNNGEVYGEVIAFDTPEAIRANARVQEAYLGSVLADQQAAGH